MKTWKFPSFSGANAPWIFFLGRGSVDAPLVDEEKKSGETLPG